MSNPYHPGAMQASTHVLAPLTGSKNGRRYMLEVRQQPQRARMCGFGDKDRRPITPPPCVRLIVVDESGQEVDTNNIDHSMFVLNCDLWTASGEEEVNMVKSSGQGAQISTASPAPFSSMARAAPKQELEYHQYPGQQYPSQQYPSQQYSGQQYSGQFVSQPPHPPPGQWAPPMQQHSQQSYPPPHHAGYGQPNGQYPPSGQYPPAPYGQHQHQQQYSSMYNGQPMSGQFPPPQSMGYPPSNMPRAPQYDGHRMSISGNQGSGHGQGMFTRNLIGSVTASAFKLTDDNDNIGIWFVLQDLSIRTEGQFRLKFSFLDVGAAIAEAHNNGGSPLTKSRAPILANVFTDVFTVYSAKKFPGVCESTSLSKVFATQGIKIPIRKDNQGGGRGGNDDDDDGEN